MIEWFLDLTSGHDSPSGPGSVLSHQKLDVFWVFNHPRVYLRWSFGGSPPPSWFHPLHVLVPQHDANYTVHDSWCSLVWTPSNTLCLVVFKCLQSLLCSIITRFSRERLVGPREQLQISLQLEGAGAPPLTLWWCKPSLWTMEGVWCSRRSQVINLSDPGHFWTSEPSSSLIDLHSVPGTFPTDESF